MKHPLAALLLSAAVALSPFAVLAQAQSSSDSQVEDVYLKASTVKIDGQFGHSVAISGDTAVVGAPQSESVFVFVNRTGVWRQQAILKPSHGADHDGSRLPYSGDLFGCAVAISGDTIVVGAQSEDSSAVEIDGDQTDNSAENAGAAYVFERRAGVWSQQAYLKASNAQGSNFFSTGDAFGCAVAISGNAVVVGAFNEASSATGIDGNQTDDQSFGAGAVYVFERSGGSWSQQAYIKASNTNSRDYFGYSVAIAGDAIVVGAPFECSATKGVNGNESDNSAESAGAAYVFARNAGVWSQRAYLKASNTEQFDQFGYSVAVAGNTVVVGANAENDFDGAAYVFEQSAGSWSQAAYLKGTPEVEYSEFGSSLAINADTLVVGATSEEMPSMAEDGTSQTGAAHLFVRQSGVWRQKARLKASNATGSDRFGASVGLSGVTVLVGAPFENNNATGVNGISTSNRAWSSGAAYLFRIPPPQTAITIVKSPDPFPPTRVGDSSRPQTLVLLNRGNETLRGLQIRFLGDAGRDFRIRGRATRSLAPGRTTRVDVIFQPTGTGLRHATLSITGNFRAKRVKLSGQGAPLAPRFPIGLP